MAKSKILRPAARELVDSYAKARVEAKAAEKTAEALREQILQLLEAQGTDTLAGDVYAIDRTVAARETLDTKMVRLMLSPAQLKTVTKTTPVTTLSVRAVDEVVVGRAA